jgi:methionyl-tRNA formyltransferase
VRTIWLSANEFGNELLKTAVDFKELDIVAIITLSSQSKTTMYDGVSKEKWQGFGIPVYETTDINCELDLIRSLNPDVIIMCGWRQILKPELIELPKKGVVGFHPTMLPFGRGGAPIINSILLGLESSGLTMFYVDGGKDSGDIIGQEPFHITSSDYAEDIYNKIIDCGRILVRKYLPLIALGNAPRVPQLEDKAEYLPPVSYVDNEIIPDQDDPEVVMRKIRAFSKPYRGAFIRVRNKKIVIWKADLVDD